MSLINFNKTAVDYVVEDLVGTHVSASTDSQVIETAVRGSFNLPDGLRAHTHSRLTSEAGWARARIGQGPRRHRNQQRRNRFGSTGARSSFC